MKKGDVFLCILILTIIVGMAAEIWSKQPDQKRNFLDYLKVGQTVLMEESQGKYKFTIMNIPTTIHTIEAIGDDYIEVKDPVSKIIIPIYSIHSVKFWQQDVLSKQNK